MKKLIFTVAVPALLFSCGGSDYCGCAEEAAQLSLDGKTDEAKAKKEECFDMVEGKSDEEREAMTEDCPGERAAFKAIK
tara:strand:- start:131 stop:367 length:237 start_codon:yes stop_codon:yes gene_type:complete